MTIPLSLNEVFSLRVTWPVNETIFKIKTKTKSALEGHEKIKIRGVNI